MNIAAALFFSFFVAIPATVITNLVFIVIMSFPLAKARKDILLSSKEQFLTKETIEREMAKKHPTLYAIQTYMGAAILVFLIVVYVISVVTMLGFF